MFKLVMRKKQELLLHTPSQNSGFKSVKEGMPYPGNLVNVGWLSRFFKPRDSRLSTSFVAGCLYSLHCTLPYTFSPLVSNACVIGYPFTTVEYLGSVFTIINNVRNILVYT